MLLNLRPEAPTSRDAKFQRRGILKEIKLVMAVNHSMVGKTETEVASCVDISLERLQGMKRSPKWIEILEWYTGKPVEKEPLGKEPSPPKPTATEKKRKHAIYVPHKTTLYADQSGRCNGCGQKFHFKHFTVDHIMPLARGGINDLENLQGLCYYCNNLKSDKSHEYLIKRLREEGFCLDWADRVRRFGARAVFAGFSFVVTLLVLVQP